MACNLFIINDEIIFDANSCEVKSYAEGGEIITLNAPTARCLLLLIEKRGEVVSRDCFLEQVWQVRGIVVSQNTFYQNISLLRKSLKNVGLTEDIIVTVRRKGFTLAADTRIKPMEEERVVCGAGDVSESKDTPQPAFPDLARKAEVINITRSAFQPAPNESKMLKWFVTLLVVFIVLELVSLISGYLNRL